MPQRTWFITGVNSGFGRIMTEHLLERGDRIAGTARKLEQLHEVLHRAVDTELTRYATLVQRSSGLFRYVAMPVCPLYSRRMKVRVLRLT